MSISQSSKRLYRAAVLPALRGIATPCFQLAVRIASMTGVVSRPSSPSTHSQELFLIVHLSNHLGDTVMLMPMLEALRDAHPHARIECAVQSPVGSLLRLAPCLDQVHEFTFGSGPTSNLWLELRRTLTLLRIYWRSIRHLRPTTCIMPRWGAGFRDLMLAYLTQAPNRVGFASNDFDRSQPPSAYRDALLTCAVQGAQQMTEPARFVFLLGQAGLISQTRHHETVTQPSSSMRHIASSVHWPLLSTRLGIDSEASLVIIAPGASAPRRMWPLERWAALIADLHLGEHTVILLTGPGDAALAQQLHELVPASQHDRTKLVAGTTNLPESACLIAHSGLFIGNDSGPGHIAGALGVPCVILFIAAEGADPDGPSAPERVRPMGEHVACCRPVQTLPPCVGYCTADDAHCILQIQPGEVLRAMNSLPEFTATSSKSQLQPMDASCE